MSTKLTGTKSSLPSVKVRRLSAALYNWENLIQTHFHGTVEVQTVMYFLYVASKAEPVDVSNVAKALGLTKASASRNYYRLSVGIRDKAEGLGLIESIDDPLDYRRKLLQLTPKGTEVANDLASNIVNAVGRIQNVSEE